MNTRQFIVDTILKMEALLRKQYGVQKLTLFGSVARGENRPGSDIDICVETATPNPFLLVDLQEYITRKIGQPVDIVRMHKHINPYLLSQIQKDGIPIF